MIDDPPSMFPGSLTFILILSHHTAICGPCPDVNILIVMSRSKWQASTSIRCGPSRWASCQHHPRIDPPLPTSWAVTCELDISSGCTAPSATMASCHHLPPFVLASWEHPKSSTTPATRSYLRFPVVFPISNDFERQSRWSQVWIRRRLDERPLRCVECVMTPTLLSNLLSTLSFIPFHVLPHLEANRDAHTIRSYSPDTPSACATSSESHWAVICSSVRPYPTESVRGPRPRDRYSIQ